ncbi:MAG: L,D-transpeptidase family protein [Chthoniobacterales bacterium]
MFRPSLIVVGCCLLLPSLRAQDPPQIVNQVIVSVKEQKLMLLQNGAKVTTYPVSTSKFGIGDSFGKMTTPIGAMAVAQKIGDHAPVGAVFHNRRFTGEILKPNAPGRDPITTRIIWLRGLEPSTAHAFARCIYIHGTAEERTIGRPASFGCIRMKANDVASLYRQLPIGATVQVIPDKLPRVPKAKKVYEFKAPDVPQEVGRPEPFLNSQQRSGETGKSATIARESRGTNET